VDLNLRENIPLKDIPAWEYVQWALAVVTLVAGCASFGYAADGAGVFVTWALGGLSIVAGLGVIFVAHRFAHRTPQA
jgi:hypothetical protein